MHSRIIVCPFDILVQVMWHPDIIHAVEDEDSAQLHPSNVVYTAALPMCPLNARSDAYFGCCGY
jgi:hypothetical protein